MAVFRKAGMIRDVILQGHVAKPAVSPVQVDFLAQAACGADAEAE